MIRNKNFLPLIYLLDELEQTGDYRLYTTIICLSETTNTYKTARRCNSCIIKTLKHKTMNNNPKLLISMCDPALTVFKVRIVDSVECCCCRQDIEEVTEGVQLILLLYNI